MGRDTVPLADLQWVYTSASTGNPFVLGGANAVGTQNPIVVNEAEQWYNNYGSTPDLAPGVHYVYNVVDTALPNYTAALGLVGFNNTGSALPGVSAHQVSNLCAGIPVAGGTGEAPRQVITADGFIPLGTSGGPAGSNTLGTHCREFAG